MAAICGFKTIESESEGLTLITRYSSWAGVALVTAFVILVSGAQSDEGGFQPLSDSFESEFNRTWGAPTAASPITQSPQPQGASLQPTTLSSASLTTSPRIRVMTFNVYGVPLPWMDHSRYRIVGQMLRRERQQGTAPDILFLQEMLNSRTSELIREAGYPYALQAPRASGLALSSGLSILSNFPLRLISNHQYGTCVSWDCISRKAVMLAEVQLPPSYGLRSPVYLANTHTNSNLVADAWSDTAAPADIRIQQLQEMREALNGLPSHAPMIVGGDMNIRRPDEESDFLVAIFGGLGLTNSIDHCGRSPFCTNSALAAAAYRDTIDHLFHRPGTSPRISLEPVHFSRAFETPVNGQPLSDHKAIVVDYAVR